MTDTRLGWIQTISPDFSERRCQKILIFCGLVRLPVCYIVTKFQNFLTAESKDIACSSIGTSAPHFSEHSCQNTMNFGVLVGLDVCYSVCKFHSDRTITRLRNALPKSVWANQSTLIHRWLWIQRGLKFGVNATLLPLYYPTKNQSFLMRNSKYIEGSSFGNGAQNILEATCLRIVIFGVLAKLSVYYKVTKCHPDLTLIRYWNGHLNLVLATSIHARLPLYLRPDWDDN